MSARAWHWRRWNLRCRLVSAYGICHRQRNHRGEHATFIGGGQKFLPYYGRSRGGKELWFVFGESAGYRTGALR